MRVDGFDPPGVWRESIPSLKNDLGFRTFVETGVIPIDIDIKPGSDPNAINLGSKGLISVAIISSESFDATQVDADTVELAGTSLAIRGKGNNFMSHEEDVNGDGLIDLVVHVETQNLDPGLFQDGRATITGTTLNGEAFEGSDEIIILPTE